MFVNQKLYLSLRETLRDSLRNNGHWKDSKDTLSKVINICCEGILGDSVSNVSHELQKGNLEPIPTVPVFHSILAKYGIHVDVGVARKVLHDTLRPVIEDLEPSLMAMRLSQRSYRFFYRPPGFQPRVPNRYPLCFSTNPPPLGSMWLISGAEPKYLWLDEESAQFYCALFNSLTRAEGSVLNEDAVLYTMFNSEIVFNDFCCLLSQELLEDLQGMDVYDPNVEMSVFEIIAELTDYASLDTLLGCLEALFECNLRIINERYCFIYRGEFYDDLTVKWMVRKLFVALVSNSEASEYLHETEVNFRDYLFKLIKAVLSDHDFGQLNAAA